ncbi:MAG: response regulator [Lachnospiraceae bacterium]|nr:response regulator [Lachnospiraceae bacterium]
MEFSRVERENILIIDDVTSNLMTLADIIRDAGFTVRPVANVRHAMMAVEAGLPDLILLDVTMPHMNGFEYCRILKKDVKTRDIPVIFISALNSAQDRIKGFECGGSDYVSKPVEKTEILLRIDMHLRMYRLQQELTNSNKKLHTIVASQLAQIENERRNIVLALATLTENKDDETGNHLDNISANARLIAMGLSFTRKYEKLITSDFINMIEAASRLHDIGKIAVSDRILQKEGHLNTEERRIMMSHTTAGIDALKKIYSDNTENGFIRMAMDIAHYHHEKWNGQGYPAGLKGTQIPLAARIMAVVDTYDALVSERCYKPAFSHVGSVNIIKEEAGISFDPDVVDIFCRLEKQLKHGQYDQTVPDEEIEPVADTDAGYDAMDGRR